MKNKKAVSLVELSVVLTIIGLILAATVQGYNIKKSAEVRSLINDVRTYQNAITGFYSKFNTLPGDMPDASGYWNDVANACDANCNGNNNGRIELGSLSNSESYRAWQHLTLSEFLEGGYTGIAATTVQADIGVNVPSSKRVKVGYSIFYDNDETSTMFDTDMATGEGSRNEINLGAFNASSVNTNSAVTPAEALSIDMKLDDGNPLKGQVHALDGADATVGGCMTNPGPAIYTVTTKTFACRMTFPAKL